MKAALSNQCTMRFADAEDVNTKLDTKVVHWPPEDKWMSNMGDAQFWKAKESTWGKGPKLRTTASELFKSMLCKLLFLNSMDKCLTLPRGCWNRIG